MFKVWNETFFCNYVEVFPPNSWELTEMHVQQHQHRSRRAGRGSLSHGSPAGEAGSLAWYPGLFWGVSATAPGREEWAQFPLHPLLFYKQDAVTVENTSLNMFILIINEGNQL